MHEPEEIERDEQLHQQGIDQYKIANRLRAIHDRVGRHAHTERHANGEDGDLTKIEPGE